MGSRRDRCPGSSVSHLSPAQGGHHGVPGKDLVTEFLFLSHVPLPHAPSQSPQTRPSYASAGSTRRVGSAQVVRSSTCCVTRCRKVRGLGQPAGPGGLAACGVAREELEHRLWGGRSQNSGFGVRHSRLAQSLPESLTHPRTEKEGHQTAPPRAHCLGG